MAQQSGSGQYNSLDCDVFIGLGQPHNPQTDAMSRQRQAPPTSAGLTGTCCAGMVRCGNAISNALLMKKAAQSTITVAEGAFLPAFSNRWNHYIFTPALAADSRSLSTPRILRIVFLLPGLVSPKEIGKPAKSFKRSMRWEEFGLNVNTNSGIVNTHSEKLPESVHDGPEYTIVKPDVQSSESSGGPS